MTIMSNGGVTQRYLMPVEMLLFTAIVALLVPAEGLRPAVTYAPIVAFTVLVLVVSAFNYRWTNTYRHDAPRWTDQVKLAAIECQQPGRREVSVRSGPRPWYSLVTVPCHALHGTSWCQDPFCVEVGAPQPAADTPWSRTGRGTKEEAA
jgi:hypothetical protein